MKQKAVCCSRPTAPGCSSMFYLFSKGLYGSFVELRPFSPQPLDIFIIIINYQRKVEKDAEMEKRAFFLGPLLLFQPCSLLVPLLVVFSLYSWCFQQLSVTVGPVRRKGMWSAVVLHRPRSYGMIRLHTGHLCVVSVGHDGGFPVAVIWTYSYRFFD